MHVAIACGGTGGHLFPGVAVGSELHRRGVEVSLIVSQKEVDAVALRGEERFRILKLPAVGFTAGRWMAGLRGLWASYRLCREAFSARPVHAVLAMGGFTSAAPMIVGRAQHAALFLHDSNAIPGRANRWLARWVDEAFIAFDAARARLRCDDICLTGTPVRSQLTRPGSPAPSRVALGLDPLRPVLLIMGGSQGAKGLNDAVLSALPALMAKAPELQFLHLTGAGDAERVSKGYASVGAVAVVHPFLSEMERALGAATLVVSRAGASSLAEFAAMGLPPILIPFPHAAEDHQTANARCLADIGGALWMSAEESKTDRLSAAVLDLLKDGEKRERMTRALQSWHRSDAAVKIADRIRERVAAIPKIQNRVLPTFLSVSS